MKACFIGAGSIGQRHIRNLHAVCTQRGVALEVHLLRATEKPLPEAVTALVSRQAGNTGSLDAAYDAIFITNPTHLHYQTLQAFAGRSNHFFIEKPLFEHTDKDLDALGLKPGSVCYVACPVRYSNVVAQARLLAAQTPIICARAICSTYLPDWRAQTDYRTVYSARKAQGGGVCLDLIHEWDYLTDLFGFPDQVLGLCGRFSCLEIDSEDLAVYVGRYPDKLVEIHLDYFGRLPRRQLELFTEQAVWTFDILGQRVCRNGELHLDCEEDPNGKYLREMASFLDLCENRTTNRNELAHAMRVMALAELDECGRPSGSAGAVSNHDVDGDDFI